MFGGARRRELVAVGFTGPQTKELTLWTHWAAEQIKRQYVEEAIADFEKKTPASRSRHPGTRRTRSTPRSRPRCAPARRPDIFYAEPDQSEYYENSFLLDLSN